MLTLQVIACIGIITGAFLLFHIRLNDFTGNIFHRLLDAPKGIREEILEETKRRKKSYFRREIEEVQAILKTTDREELFPLLCTASLLLFAAGAAIAVMIGNVFLIPVLACGFLFLPFWYIRPVSYTHLIAEFIRHCDEGSIITLHTMVCRVMMLPSSQCRINSAMRCV